MTAIYYGVRPLIAKDGAHAIMMDANWRDAAASIADWLAESCS